MKKLTRKELADKIAEMQDASEGGAVTWNHWYDKYAYTKAILEFPAGELMNSGLAGFVQAWKALDIIQVGASKKQGIEAQGLEPMVKVELSLVSALLAAHELPQYRRLVRVEK